MAAYLIRCVLDIVCVLGVPRQPVELGNDQHSLLLTGKLYCSLDLLSLAAGARLHLYKLGDDLPAVALHVSPDGLALRFKTETGLALSLGRYPEICYVLVHGCKYSTIIN